MILIIDAGSQYSALLRNSISFELGVETIVLPFDCDSHPEHKEQIKGIIISGGPDSTVNISSKSQSNQKFLSSLLEFNVPLLGICFGMQWISSCLGGVIDTLPKGEFGRTELQIKADSTILKGFENCSAVWMSHSDSVTKLPEGFNVTASTKDCPIAVAEDESRHIFLTQFHPEVKHSVFGKRLLQNFLAVCGCEQPKNPNGNLYSLLVDDLVENVRRVVGNNHVLLALSGGVDSSTLCLLLARAIPNQVHCVFVDNGFMRHEEVEEIKQRFSKQEGVQFHTITAADEFFMVLEGISDPEEKRKRIGNTFVRVFEEKIRFLRPQPVFMAQGTICPDVIESQALGNKAHLIKSHHNVGGMPSKLKLKLLEPFRHLFKDQVRLIGGRLGMASDVLRRHPFPGPGLAIRVVGAVNQEKVEIARKADHIFISLLREKALYDKVSQAFVALLPVKAVGVVGDRRRYGYCLVLRAVKSDDFMTANVAILDDSFLGEVSREIVNSLSEIARVFYDITSKPPGTIEME